MRPGIHLQPNCLYIMKSSYKNYFPMVLLTFFVYLLLSLSSLVHHKCYSSSTALRSMYLVCLSPSVSWCHVPVSCNPGPITRLLSISRRNAQCCICALPHALNEIHATIHKANANVCKISALFNKFLLQSLLAHIDRENLSYFIMLYIYILFMNW